MNDHSDQERDRVIKDFRADLDQSRRSDGPLWQQIKSLADRVESGEKLALMCWCHPKPCHGNIIEKAVTFELKQRHHAQADYPSGPR